MAVTLLFNINNRGTLLSSVDAAETFTVRGLGMGDKWRDVRTLPYVSALDAACTASGEHGKRLRVSKSIWPAVVAHTVMNFLVLAGVLLLIAGGGVRLSVVAGNGGLTMHLGS
jgi:hypothetical protein